MSNNDDLVNNILRELDNAPKETPPAETPPVEKPSGKEGGTAEKSTHTEETPHEEKRTPRNNAPLRNTPQQNDRKPERAYPTPVRENNSAPPRRKKKKKKRSRLPGVLILTTFIFAVSICLSMVIIAFGKDMLGIGKSEKTVPFVIREGATTQEIADQLKDDGIIRSPKFFVLFSRLRKSDAAYIAGEHYLRPNMAYETIISNLTTAEDIVGESVEVTFPEGITLYDAADILQENNVCSAEDFIFYFNSGDYGFDFESRLPTDYSLKFCRMEGYCFPDTYIFTEGMDPEQVCMKIYSNFNSKMEENDRYEKLAKRGVSLDELITLASIVQKEAATVDVMNAVASVFWNRLEHSDEFPLLQSDPTTNYAQNVIKPHLEVVNKTMVDAYDTYVGAGLPPGAICNPGTDAIDAVLDAVDTPFFYFIANTYTGETMFAETLEQHEANQALIEQQMAEYEAAQQEEQNE